MGSEHFSVMDQKQIRIVLGKLDQTFLKSADGENTI